MLRIVSFFSIFTLLLYVALILIGGTDGKTSSFWLNGVIGLAGVAACVRTIYRFWSPQILSAVDWIVAIVALGPIIWLVLSLAWKSTGNSA